MKKEIGLWIDHRKAVIVIVSDEGEQVTEIISDMEKHTRFAGRGSEHGSDEDMRDRQFGNYLNDYYDKVIAVIRDGNGVLEDVTRKDRAAIEIRHRLRRRREIRIVGCDGGDEGAENVTID